MYVYVCVCVCVSARARCVCVCVCVWVCIARVRAIHTHTHAQVGWPASTALLTVYGSESEKWWSANWKGGTSFIWDASYKNVFT